MASLDGSESAAPGFGATTTGATTTGTTTTPASTGGPSAASKPPLYWRLLRLRQLHPNGWQRATLVEGVVGVSVILVLADVASAWTLLVLPLSTAVVVKVHDVLAAMLAQRPRAQRPEPSTDPWRRRSNRMR